jgi:hypothetical protein
MSENTFKLNKTEEIAKKLSEYIRKDSKDSYKYFSGSMFGNEPLQNYLIIKQKKQEDFLEVGQNTIGSIFHRGMEEGAKGMDGMEVEKDVDYTLSNGWTLTGTIDRVDHKEGYVDLRDYKLTKTYKGKKIKEDMTKGFFNDAYVEQMNAYALCYKNKFNTDVIMHLDMFYKDANPLKSQSAYEEIFIPEIDDFEDIAIGRTNELDEYITKSEYPPECADLWFRVLKKGEPPIPTRCQLYCGVKDACPYHQARIRNTSSQQNMSRMVNWD